MFIPFRLFKKKKKVSPQKRAANYIISKTSSSVTKSVAKSIEKSVKVESDTLLKEIKYLRQYTNRLETMLEDSIRKQNEADALLRKLEARQKETCFQLEDISESLQDDGGENRSLIDTLISVAGYIEDFYMFSSEDVTSPLFDQAVMMWNTARKSLEGSGLKIIDRERVPLDFRLHSPERTGDDESLSDGYVLKTLASGYIYKDEVIKRSLVVVNKKNRKEADKKEEDVVEDIEEDMNEDMENDIEE